jgi:hypothetical protein
MNEIKILPIILLAFASCKNEHKEEVNEAIGPHKDQTTSTDKHVSVNWRELKDTTVNGVRLSFTRLNEKEYDSLTKLSVESPIPQDEYYDLVIRGKNIQVIKIGNGKIDSLHDKNDSTGYFEKYEIKGYWKNKGQLLIRNSHWEGGGDFFINLLDGSYYYLNSTYKLSPKKNFILGFTDMIEIEGNDFMLTDISEQQLKTLFNIDFGQVVVDDLHWLEESKCLISAYNIESGNLEKKGNLYYLLTINR